LANKKLTAVVIDALEDIKARDIKLINVSKLTSVFDYLAVASADSNRQTKALARNVMDKVREAGGWIYGTEGEGSGEWVLVDCGDVVVHIMQPAVREHYKLEELWGEGKLEFPKPARAKAVPKPGVAKPVKTAAKKPAGVAVKAKTKTAKSKTAKTPAAARKKPATTAKATTTKTRSSATTKTSAKAKTAAKKPAMRKRKAAAD
jgi:ribosome-associated protein